MCIIIICSGGRRSNMFHSERAGRKLSMDGTQHRTGLYIRIFQSNSVYEAGSMLHSVSETLTRSLLSHMVKVLKVIYWSRNGVLFSELLEVSVHACRS